MAGFLHTKSSSDLGRLLLRLVVGGVLLFHGLNKVLTGIGWLVQAIGGLGIPGVLAYAVYLGEVLGPVLLIAGIKARIGAILIVTNMIVAIVLVHRHEIFIVKPQGGGWSIELDMLILVGALALFFMGPGKYRLTQSHGWGD